MKRKKDKEEYLKSDRFESMYIEKEFYYNSDIDEVVKSKNQIDQWASLESEKFKKQIENENIGGSGFSFVKVESVNIQYRRTKKTRGAAGYIELPQKLADKNAFI